MIDTEGRTAGGAHTPAQGRSGSVEAPAGEQPARPRPGIDLLAWPASGWLLCLALAVLYAPVLVQAAHFWMTDPTYEHGVFIFPLAAGLLWLRRHEIRQTPMRPVAGGVALMALGLALESSSYLLQIHFLAMWSLIPTLIGAVLALHGWGLWRIARFPILFLLLACPMPFSLIDPPARWVQHISTTGAAIIMQTLGFTVLQAGNLLEVPGMTLQVAEACSGFHKLVSLTAFALLYCYMYPLSTKQRLLLMLLVVPIALVANVLRLCGLVVFSSVGGPAALHQAHDGAEIFVIVIAFALFMLAGNSLGCKNPRFLPSRA